MVVFFLSKNLNVSGFSDIILFINTLIFSIYLCLNCISFSSLNLYLCNTKTLLLKKNLILFVFHFFAISFSISDLQAQSTNLIIDATCTNPIDNGCPTFTNTCNSNSGWTSSHGTPILAFLSKEKFQDFDYALMIGTSVGGEGMFKPFNFIAGQTYTILVNYSTTGSAGTLSLYAAKNLHQQFSNNSCQENPQVNSTKQLIGQVSNNTSITFTCNDNYYQFWMFASLSSGTQYNVSVTNITITPVCNIGAPTGLSTSNNGSTLNWNVINGASSYQIIVYDTHAGSTTVQTLSSNTNSVNYCALGAGDNIRFVVYGVCSNNSLSASSEYSYAFSNYPLPKLPSEIILTNVTSTSAVLNWTAQPGVSFYGSVYGPTGSGFSTITNSYQLTGLQSNSAYVVYLNAYNNCGVNGSTEFRFTTLADCPIPIGGVIGQSANGIMYVYLPTPTLGCLSYNLKYRDYLLPTQEYTVPNIPTSSPYILTNLVRGHSYQFSIQCNCSAGRLSLYGPWSQTPSGFYRSIQQTPNSNVGETNLTDSTSLIYHQDSSLVKMGINNFSTDLILYPNPAMNELNISFENKKMIKPEIVITDLFGKEVMKRYLNSESGKEIQTNKIKTSSLSNGVYILKLKLGNKILIQKFGIQR